MDQALRVRQRGVWRVTALILLVGVAILAWVFLGTERRRTRAVAKLELMDDQARVAQILGSPPARCPAGGLDHLRERFPTGTPPAAVEQALARLQDETAERWVYPLERGERAGCTPRRGSTEIGFDREGHVLWYVPVTGRVALEVPPEYLPAATDNE